VEPGVPALSGRLPVRRPRRGRAPLLRSLDLGPEDVDLLVVSDAEEILGIGDWGVNGTGAIVIAAASPA